MKRKILSILIVLALPVLTISLLRAFYSDVSKLKDRCYTSGGHLEYKNRTYICVNHDGQIIPRW